MSDEMHQEEMFGHWSFTTFEGVVTKLHKLGLPELAKFAAEELKCCLMKVNLARLFEDETELVRLQEVGRVLGTIAVVRKVGTAPQIMLKLEPAKPKVSEPYSDKETYLHNLLARIHRDGGHHTNEVGLEQSVIDADASVCRLLELEDDVRPLKHASDPEIPAVFPKLHDGQKVEMLTSVTANLGAQHPDAIGWGSVKLAVKKGTWVTVSNDDLTKDDTPDRLVLVSHKLDHHDIFLTFYVLRCELRGNA